MIPVLGTSLRRRNKRMLAGSIMSSMLLVFCCATAWADDSANDLLKEGESMYDGKKFADAVTVLDKAIEKDKKLTRAYLVRGQCKEKLNNLSQAIEDYEEYAVHSPSDIDVLLRLSSCYSRENKNNVALSYLSKALLLNPKSASLYTARAAMYDKLGKHDMAAIDREVAKKLTEAAVSTDIKH